MKTKQQDVLIMLISVTTVFLSSCRDHEQSAVESTFIARTGLYRNKSTIENLRTDLEEKQVKYSLVVVDKLNSIFRNRDDNIYDNFEKNSAANELFSLPELPDGVVSDLARMFRSTDEDEVWRDYCLQFLGSALEREDGVTDEDRALARETLVEALVSTNSTFAGTALRALHRGDPADSLVAESALRIARDSSYPSSSRITALLILEDCIRSTPSTSSTSLTSSTLAETASAVSADPSASALLRRTAEAVLERNAH